MSIPHRTEIDALRERKTALEVEITRLREQTSGLDALRAHETQLYSELSAVDGRLARSNAMRRPLPMLDQVRVASPCTADWNEMLGDERVRFCLGCEKNVFNLSAMRKDDAEALLQQRLGNDLCVRFYQRADGTILTQDCPVGVKKKRRKKLALAVAGAGAMTAAAATMFLTTIGTKRQGGLSAATAVYETTAHEAPQGVLPVMGDPAPLPTVQPAPPAPTTPVRVLMGRRIPSPGQVRDQLNHQNKPRPRTPPVSGADDARKQLEDAIKDTTNAL